MPAAPPGCRLISRRKTVTADRSSSLPNMVCTGRIIAAVCSQSRSGRHQNSIYMAQPLTFRCRPDDACRQVLPDPRQLFFPQGHPQRTVSFCPASHHHANLSLNLFVFGASGAFGIIRRHLDDTVSPKSAAPCRHCLKYLS